MTLEIRLVRVAPFGSMQSDETIAEYALTPLNLFDVTLAVQRIAHETMKAEAVSNPVTAAKEESGDRG